MIRIIIVLLAVAIQACSVVQATSGPERKDLGVFEQGTHRDMVLAEMGQPVVTDIDDQGRKYDIFTFKQGQHGASKAGRAFAYGVLAVATLGISEVVTSPIEGVAGKGAEMKIKVTYTANKEVLEVVVLSDDRAFKGDELESAATPEA